MIEFVLIVAAMSLSMNNIIVFATCWEPTDSCDPLRPWPAMLMKLHKDIKKISLRRCQL